jgi:Fic family protein
LDIHRDTLRKDIKDLLELGIVKSRVKRKISYK